MSRWGRSFEQPSNSLPAARRMLSSELPLVRPRAGRTVLGKGASLFLYAASVHRLYLHRLKLVPECLSMPNGRGNGRLRVSPRPATS